MWFPTSLKLGALYDVLLWNIKLFEGANIA